MKIQGTIFWLTNQIELAANFPAHGFIPETASVRAPPFDIPAALLKLKNYRRVTGNLNADWNTNRFALDFSAQSFEASTNWPPIHVAVRASGDTNLAQIDLADIAAPWFDAKLSRETRIQFSPPLLAEPATLDIKTDLEKQPWLTAKGELSGQAILTPGAARFPKISLTLSGTGLSISNVTAKTLHVACNADWPQFNLTEGNLELTDDSKISLTCGFDFQKRTVQNGELNFSGGFAKRYLPSTISFRSASFAAHFNGPLRTLTNSMTLDVEDIHVPHVKTAHLKASWQGIEMDLQQLQFALSAGGSSLQLRGAAELARNEQTLDVSALELSQSNRAELQLQKKFAVTFRRKPPGTSNLGAVAIQPLIWSGKESGLQLAASAALPRTGSFKISAHNLSAGLIRDFTDSAIPNAELESLNFIGGWTNSPVAFQFDSAASSRFLALEIRGGNPHFRRCKKIWSQIRSFIGITPTSRRPTKRAGPETHLPSVHFGMSNAWRIAVI